MKLSKVTNIIPPSVSRFVNRMGLKISKRSPEILLGVGIVGIGAGVVLACSATLKVEEIIDEHNETMEHINQAANDVTQTGYSLEDAKRDKFVLFTQTSWKLVKLYGPAATCLLGGVGAMCASFGILKKRNVALMAAYKALETSYSDYRKRVEEEFGPEADRQLKNGLRDYTIENDDGTKDEIPDVKVGRDISKYARFFDESNRHWSKSADNNLHFLRCNEDYANKLLINKGHLFLNDVYEMLGFPDTKEGAVTGWVLDNPHGDHHIDFGIQSIWRDLATNEAHQNFRDGLERSVLLDFNVDGIILDLI